MTERLPREGRRRLLPIASPIDLWRLSTAVQHSRGINSALYFFSTSNSVQLSQNRNVVAYHIYGNFDHNPKSSIVISRTRHIVCLLHCRERDTHRRVSPGSNDQGRRWNQQFLQGFDALRQAYLAERSRAAQQILNAELYPLLAPFSSAAWTGSPVRRGEAYPSSSAVCRRRF